MESALIVSPSPLHVLDQRGMWSKLLFAAHDQHPALGHIA